MSITILVRRKHMGDENRKDAQAKRHVNVSKKGIEKQYSVVRSKNSILVIDYPRQVHSGHDVTHMNLMILNSSFLETQLSRVYQKSHLILFRKTAT
jgi:hypothetical protein